MVNLVDLVKALNDFNAKGLRALSELLLDVLDDGFDLLGHDVFVQELNEVADRVVGETFGFWLLGLLQKKLNGGVDEFLEVGLAYMLSQRRESLNDCLDDKRRAAIFFGDHIFADILHLLRKDLMSLEGLLRPWHR